MERDNFKKLWLKDSEINEFVCPVCLSGLLVKNKERRIEMISNPGQERFYDYRMEPTNFRNYFATVLKCNNLQCQSQSIISGQERVEIDSKKKHSKNPFAMYYSTTLIRYFDPAPQIIVLPELQNKVLKHHIEKSFSLFWFDLGSCANCLRIAIEIILESEGILHKSGIGYKTLNNMIDEYQGETSVKELMKKIKWVGNQGSHASYLKLSREDIIPAFETMELILQKLFSR